MSQADDLTKTSTVLAIAQAHHKADVNQGGEACPDGPVGYMTGLVTVQDDLRDVCGYTESMLEDLSDEDFDEMRKAIVTAYVRLS